MNRSNDTYTNARSYRLSIDSLCRCNGVLIMIGGWGGVVWCRSATDGGNNRAKLVLVIHKTVHRVSWDYIGVRVDCTENVSFFVLVNVCWWSNDQQIYGHT